MADNSMTKTSQFTLPKELVFESNRRARIKSEQFRVEGWRRSWLTRLSELLVGKD